MKGINLSILILCFAAAVAILAGVGFYDAAGAHVVPGIESDVDRVESDMGEESELENTGGIFGLFDLATAAVDGITVLWALITNIDAIIMSLAPDPRVLPIANWMQVIGIVLFGLAIIQVVRGFVIEQ